jgi:hypothetical protein
MDLRPTPSHLALAPSQFLRLQAPRGVCLAVQRGTLWVTVDGRSDDIQLGAGERYCFGDDTRTPALIGALGGVAEFCAVRGERPPRAGMPRLARA